VSNTRQIKKHTRSTTDWTNSRIRLYTGVTLDNPCQQVPNAEQRPLNISEHSSQVFQMATVRNLLTRQQSSQYYYQVCESSNSIIFTRFIVTVQPIWDRKHRAWTCSVVEILGVYSILGWHWTTQQVPNTTTTCSLRQKGPLTQSHTFFTHIIRAVSEKSFNSTKSQQVRWMLASDYTRLIFIF
jgi:hypothetical protein